MDPERIFRERRSIRLKGYDYHQPASYFVTTNTCQNIPLFGEIIGGRMELNALGKAVQQTWKELPQHYDNIELDAFVVMPNHVHALVEIVSRRYPLTEVVRALKTYSARRINEIRGTKGVKIWQRSFHERIVRNLRELSDIRAYIRDNPAKWRG